MLVFYKILYKASFDNFCFQNIHKKRLTLVELVFFLFNIILFFREYTSVFSVDFSFSRKIFSYISPLIFFIVSV